MRGRWGAAATLALLNLMIAGSAPAQEGPLANPRRAQDGVESRRRGAEVRLVVVIVVDGLRAGVMDRFGRLFGEGGFRRLLDEGAVLTEAHFTHARTLTGPGHATLLSGLPPSVHGIVANWWYDRALRRAVYCIGDSTAPPLNRTPMPGEGFSPAGFSGTTVGDRLRQHTGGAAKVVAIAQKDRAAILLAGARGTAYWYDERTGEYTTSAHYAPELPAWLARLNAERIPDRAFGSAWRPLLAPMAYAPAAPDDGLYAENKDGIGTRFPHVFTGGLDAPGPRYYAAYRRHPDNAAFLFEAAGRAIETEALGEDEVPDLLALGLGTHDRLCHSFGPGSLQVHDFMARLDRMLSAFLARAEAAVGPGGTLTVLTADHGFLPVPERLRGDGVAARRLPHTRVAAACDSALDAAFGPADWVVPEYVESPLADLYLDPAALARRGVTGADAEAVARGAVASLEDVAGAWTRTELLDGGPRIPNAIRESFHPERSGDVIFEPEPHTLAFTSYALKSVGTSHGSSHSYDTHIPLVFAGPGVRPGAIGGACSALDLAPTLYALLGMEPPPGGGGRVLNEVLAGR